jgi:NADH-quinone oxidoreductase subunit N
MIVAGGNELSALFLGVCLALISSTVFQWLSDSDPLKRLDIKKWFAVTSVSLAVLAFGMAFLYGLSATTQIVQGKVTMAVVHLTNENIGVILVIVEVLLLVGVAGILLPLPFSNMSGLRSGGALISMRDVCRFLMMATVGLLLFAKLFANELSAFQGPEMSPNDWGILASVAAILTMLLAPYYAMKSTDIVATAMWLSLSHIGYAWQLWIWLNPKSITAAGFLQLSLLAPLFLLGLLSRTVRFRTGDGSGASAIGLWHRSPLVAGVFIVGLVSFVGAPATIGYTARYLLIQSSWSTIDLNSFGLWGYITFVACVVSSVLTVAAVIPWMRAIFTEGKADHSRDWRGMEKVMAIALACLIIGFGLYSQPLYSAASTLPTSFGFLQP